VSIPSPGPLPEQHCPACGARVAVNPRYPRYACRECVATATTLDGRPAEIIQSHVFRTGAGLRLLATGEHVPDSPTDAAQGEANCLVRGRPARASEAHMGGIAVEII